MDDNIEIPEYFICPISLQIMKDPITAISGITYDRESIENWLFKRHNTICPVTKQPLPRDPELTPNHTLSRLIQAWCTSNGIDRIATPKPPLSKLYVMNLIRDLSVQDLQLKTLQKLESLAMENDRNRVCMVEAGLGEALTSFIISCYRRRSEMINGLEEALSILYILRRSLVSMGPLTEDDEIIESLIWILAGDYNPSVKSHAAHALKSVIQKANPGLLQRLKPEFFKTITSNIRDKNTKTLIPQQASNALLHVLLQTCPWGRNRVAMIESGSVFSLVEVELRSPEKKTTELVLGILYHLCSCSDGRAQLLNHAAGIAVIARRILVISTTSDDRAVMIVWLLCKYSATNGVLQEMLRVGTVAKLCMVMQSNCAWRLKEKIREILKRHYDVWKDSPCVEVAFLTGCVR
ncbi:hypothetical protein BUALT_Bualt11G0090200 [Buddleja alternifolia]|uniref:U-box domain-containing protein n=1 Tax=Buddleja alternifolia TaxID=168488 RepID=A0AAV6WU20_9LAMI|nr:hypothetical protein BUALT_Bualt11G0090200 [Buddleja alternifolia]